MVVAQQRLAHHGRGRQVTHRAEHVAGGSGRVEHVVGVGHPVAVAVLAPLGPRAGQEPHRPDRPVERGVAIPLAAVGVADDRCAGHRPVEEGTHDPAARVALGVDPAAEGVSGLDPSDARDEPPGQVAGRLGRREESLRLPVCGEDGDRDPGCAVGDSRRTGQRLRRLRLDRRRVDGGRGRVDRRGHGRVRRGRSGRRPRHERPSRRTVVGDRRRADRRPGGSSIAAATWRAEVSDRAAYGTASAAGRTSAPRQPMRSTGRITARVVLVDGAPSGRREAWSTRSPADGTGSSAQQTPAFG